MKWRSQVCAGVVLGLAVATAARAQAVDSVAVTPATADVPVDGPLVLTALVLNNAGSPIEGETVDWTVDTGGTVATPSVTDANGEATAVFTAGSAADTATVTATAGGVPGTAVINVYVPVLTTFNLSPASVLLHPDEVQDFTLEALDQFDATMAVSITWSVSSAGTLTNETDTGVTYTAAAAADTDILTADDAGGATATADITVEVPVVTTLTLTPATVTLAASGTQDFTLEALDQFGDPIAASITWSVSSGGTLTNEADTGVTYTAAAAADTDVLTATDAGGAIGTADITVEVPVVTTLTLTPATVTLAASGTQDFTLAALDQFGATIAASITWSVSSGGTLTNEADTGVTYTAAAAADTDVLTATDAGGAIGTADITVTGPPTLTTVTVTPALAAVAPGGTKTFVAATLDQYGAPITATIAWTVAPDVGSFDTTAGATVVYTASATEETVVITATADSSVTGTASLVVVAAANVAMKLDCGTDTPTAGWDAGNTYVTGGNNFTWPGGTWDVSAANAAPEQVYLTVRHQEHSYDIPVPDGDYIVRIHFCDGFTGARALDYTLEGVEEITDLDPGAQAGGPYIALPLDVTVTVSDGNGLQIEASWDTEVDCFEAGIEIIGQATGPVPDSITVTPADVILGVDDTQDFTAEALDDQGDPMSPQPTITWTLTGDGSIDATEGASVTYTAPATDGSATLTASASGVDSVAATITVSSTPVPAIVTVDPVTATVDLDATLVITVTVIDQFGDPLESEAVTWAVTGATIDSASGTTDASGQDTTTLTAASIAGEATVTATAGGLSATATITMEALAVTTITVDPATQTIYVDATAVLTVTTLDQNGDPISVAVDLAVDAGGTLDAATGTTDAVDGTLTSTFTSDGSTGTFTLTVTSGTVSGTAAITVKVKKSGDGDGCVPGAGSGLGMALLAAALAALHRKRR